MEREVVVLPVSAVDRSTWMDASRSSGRNSLTTVRG
jgi:hypothetical protein